MNFVNRFSFFRFLLIGIMFLPAVLAEAQSSHMTFQGIPIDGHMSEFMQKLEAKGWKYDFEENLHTNNLSTDYKSSYYTGKYEGYTCRLHFDYKKDSKIVYNVHIEIGCDSKEKAEETFKILKKKNDASYRNWNKTIVDFDIYENYYWGSKYGYVCMSMGSGMSAYPFPYDVDLSFTDLTNENK